MHFGRFALQFFIACFFFWHASAVLVYTIPLKAQMYPAQWLSETIKPKMKPYLLKLSQWQSWELFSPDPLRRVTVFAIDAKEDDTWKEIEVIDGETMSWRYRSTESKTMRRLMKTSKRKPLRSTFLRAECTRLQLEPETAVRLRVRTYVIPQTSNLLSQKWWQSYKPQWNEKLDASATCPSSEDLT